MPLAPLADIFNEAAAQARRIAEFFTMPAPLLIFATLLPPSACAAATPLLPMLYAAAALFSPLRAIDMPISVDCRRAAAAISPDGSAIAAPPRFFRAGARHAARSIFLR